MASLKNFLLFTKMPDSGQKSDCCSSEKGAFVLKDFMFEKFFDKELIDFPKNFQINFDPHISFHATLYISDKPEKLREDTSCQNFFFLST